jgi:ribosomal protein L16 Arg81 hydroxylase
MNRETRDLFLQMIGGCEEHFFREYWRKRPLFTPGALPQLIDFYDHARFMQDYQRVDFHNATLIINIDQQNNRRMLRPDHSSSVDRALAEGLSVVLQALLLPDNLAHEPQPWKWFVSLHQELCEYLLPGFSYAFSSGGPIAAVDIFCTSSESKSGGHYDTGDVFYFVLEGEKEWTVELTADMEMGLKLASEGYRFDLAPRKEYIKITVRPGDALYVPPYTYHRVCSTGKSLAVSLGLPTFTEMTLIRGSLMRMQKERPLFRPLPNFPRTQGELSRSADEEIRRRTLSALGLDKIAI